MELEDAQDCQEKCRGRREVDQVPKMSCWKGHCAPYEESGSNPRVDQCRAGVGGVAGYCETDRGNQQKRQHSSDYPRLECLRYLDPVEAGQSGSKEKNCEQSKDLGEHQLGESEGIVEVREDDDRRHEHRQCRCQEGEAKPPGIRR